MGVGLTNAGKTASAHFESELIEAIIDQ